MRKFKILFFFLLFGFLAFIFFKVVNLDKFIYLNKTNDNSTEIVIIDSPNDRIIKYLIPADIKLESARGYGNYKLSSLWELAERDKLYGKLIAETITKNFYIPVYMWKDGNKSNLSISQKIKTWTLRNRSGKYQFVFDTFRLPNSILINFSDSRSADFFPKIEIDDLTGTIDSIEKVSKIIETLGWKITSNSKGFDAELDCVVFGKDDNLINLFVNVLGCEKDDDSTIQTDLKIRLGAKFSERF